MNVRFKSLLFLLLLLAPSTGRAAFDLEAWKLQYGTALTPSAFYSTRPGPWGDYFSSTSVDCANATFLYLGPLGIKARPFDQALSTSAFAVLYPPTLVDPSGLIQNSFGVLAPPRGRTGRRQGLSGRRDSGNGGPADQDRHGNHFPLPHPGPEFPRSGNPRRPARGRG